MATTRNRGQEAQDKFKKADGSAKTASRASDAASRLGAGKKTRNEYTPDSTAGVRIRKAIQSVQGAQKSMMNIRTIAMNKLDGADFKKIQSQEITPAMQELANALKNLEAARAVQAPDQYVTAAQKAVASAEEAYRTTNDYITDRVRFYKQLDKYNSQTDAQKKYGKAKSTNDLTEKQRKKMGARRTFER